MSKIINGVASEYDMPMIYENKTMTNRLGNEEIFTRWQDPTIEQLQQENQQLKDINTYDKRHLYKMNKDRLEANERLQQERDLYKSVIEEVREFVKGLSLEDEFLQILDKVKGE